MKSGALFFLLLFPISAFSQTSIGIDTRAYPAGVIPAVQFNVGLTENYNLSLKGMYNFTNRRDWGKQTNEEGSGFGFGVSFERKRIFTDQLSAFISADLQFIDIDWMDLRYTPCLIDQDCIIWLDATRTEVFGSTSTTVLQPTIGFGYQIPVSNNFFIKPTLSFGYEINIHTKGEEVGEGAILLGGLQIGYLFDAR